MQCVSSKVIGVPCDSGRVIRNLPRAAQKRAKWPRAFPPKTCQESSRGTGGPKSGRRVPEAVQDAEGLPKGPSSPPKSHQKYASSQENHGKLSPGLSKLPKSVSKPAYAQPCYPDPPHFVH